MVPVKSLLVATYIGLVANNVGVHKKYLQESLKRVDNPSAPIHARMIELEEAKFYQSRLENFGFNLIPFAHFAFISPRQVFIPQFSKLEYQFLRDNCNLYGPIFDGLKKSLRKSRLLSTV